MHVDPLPPFIEVNRQDAQRVVYRLKDNATYIAPVPGLFTEISAARVKAYFVQPEAPWSMTIIPVSEKHFRMFCRDCRETIVGWKADYESLVRAYRNAALPHKQGTGS